MNNIRKSKQSLPLSFLFLVLMLTLFISRSVTASDPPHDQVPHALLLQDTTQPISPRITPSGNNCPAHIGSSPFNPYDTGCDDTIFIVDDAPMLDTGCLFRSGGPIIFNLEVDRYPGNLAQLRANDLIDEMATLRMPAFDVDVNGASGVPQPELDKVYFNGHYIGNLNGDNDIWHPNAFQIPIDQIHFPDDPDENGTLIPATNEIRIDIDVLSTDEDWCTAIDWAALSINMVRPILFAHGIISNGGTWTGPWTNTIGSLGIPYDNSLNMGWLDSIQDNAGDIAIHVAALKQRWGIDTINIVAHSKGGIDSRHFAEISGDVEKLIQIGTPNAGSPLANAVQILGLLLEPELIILLDALATPAGYQLTTPYMFGYNAFHGPHPDTYYVSLAGNYTFGGLGFWDAILSIIMGGPSDLVVPVDSVHALNYSEHLLYSSSGSTHQAQHTSQTKSVDIRDLLLPKVATISASNNNANLSKHNETTSVSGGSFAETGTIAYTISQGQTKTYTLFMDSAGTSSFSMFYIGSDLDLVLESPSGVHIDPAVASSDPNIEFESFEVLPNYSLDTYTLNISETGLWTLEVSAITINQAGGEAAFSLKGILADSTIQLTGQTDQDYYTNGNPIIIYADMLDNNAPIAGAVVSVTVRLPDESRSVVTLLDDGNGDDLIAGDGTYSGRLSDTAQPGSYAMLITAAGQPPQPFSRDLFIATSVSSSQSQLDGTFSDYGNDTNGDSLFEELVINVGVNVTSMADYRLLGTLSDSNDNPITQATIDATLAPGSQTVSLHFSGQDIFEHGVDGPYTLSVVRLAEDDGFTILPIDEQIDAHITSVYNHSQFQHSAIYLPGTGTDTAVDTDGNGRFNRLDINLDIELLQSGTYQWTGVLKDSTGHSVDFIADSGFLSSGSNSLSFSFDSDPIGSNGVDGPYILDDLLIFSSSNSAVHLNVYTTAAYDANDFDFISNVFLPYISNGANGTPSSCIPDPPGESDNVNDAILICSDQMVSGHVADVIDQSDVYKIYTEAGQQITLSMNGSGGDADLYLFAPETTNIYIDPWTARSISVTNNEFIQFTANTAGTWYIVVYSYSGATDYNVTSTLSPSLRTIIQSTIENTGERIYQSQK